MRMLLVDVDAFIGVGDELENPICRRLHFVRQLLTLAVSEQDGVENAWFGPALSHRVFSLFPGPGCRLLCRPHYRLKCISCSSISGATSLAIAW